MCDSIPYKHKHKHTQVFHEMMINEDMVGGKKSSQPTPKK